MLPVSLKEMLTRKHNVSEKLLISKHICFRGIIYQTGSFVCFKKDSELGLYYLCQIKFILVNENLENCFFVGFKEQIYYNQENGLYFTAQKEESHTVNIILSFEELICVETLLSLNNDESYYFKSAPLEYF